MRKEGEGEGEEAERRRQNIHFSKENVHSQSCHQISTKREYMCIKNQKKSHPHPPFLEQYTPLGACHLSETLRALYHVALRCLHISTTSVKQYINIMIAGDVILG